MSVPDKVKCPECDADIAETDNKCPKCGFDLDGFDGFFRNFRAANKLLGTKPSSNPPKSKRSWADPLINLTSKK